MSRRPLPRPSREQLAADYQTRTITMLAHLYGVSSYTARRWLMAYRIPRRHSGERVPTGQESSHGR